MAAPNAPRLQPTSKMRLISLGTSAITSPRGLTSLGLKLVLISIDSTDIRMGLISFGNSCA